MALIVMCENVDTSIFIQSDEVMVLKKPEFEKNVKSFRLKNTQHLENKKCGKNTTNSISKHFEVCSAAVSNCGNLIVICDTNNSLHLWKLDQNKYEIISTRNVMRKCHKVIFTNSCTEVILADRGGDVFVYSVSEYNKEGKFALGHLSFITDICISYDDKLLVTSDRDGKIRISSYPNCYNIVSYCLGHEEFVSSVFFLSPSVLISGSGDGSLRSWNCKDGSELFCEGLYENNLFLKDLNVENIHLNTSTENSQTSKKDTANFAVQSLKFNKELSLLIVLYHFIEGITVYKIRDSKFQYIQFIKLPCPAIDALITTCGNLLVLIRQSPSGLLNFNYSVDTGCIVEADRENVSDISSEVQNFYGDFKKIVNISVVEPMLFKKQFEDPDDDELNKSKQIKFD